MPWVERGDAVAQTALLDRSYCSQPSTDRCITHPERLTPPSNQSMQHFPVPSDQYPYRDNHLFKQKQRGFWFTGAIRLAHLPDDGPTAEYFDAAGNSLGDRRYQAARLSSISIARCSGAFTAG